MIDRFNEFLDYVAKYQNEHPDQRDGQSLFNALYHVRPALADGFRGGVHDPSEFDHRIQSFLDTLEEHWG